MCDQFCSRRRWCTSYNAFGKPSLASETASLSLRFNVSHSHQIALYAFSIDREVGVDVEHVRQDSGAFKIAEQFFSPREIVELRSLPPVQQSEAFYRCWTKKEAYINAIGQGFSYGVDQFDVSLSPEERPELLVSDDSKPERIVWQLREISLSSAYAAALAAEGSGWSLSFSEWI
ncbi:MAG: 4'-phosphopantetheinyl transferase superfamily protein [Pyrinomonadaceae bacterium]